jgi:hypothetical protein
MIDEGVIKVCIMDAEYKVSHILIFCNDQTPGNEKDFFSDEEWETYKDEKQVILFLVENPRISHLFFHQK